MKKLLKRNHGFTIIELIVVLAILSGIVVMLSKGVGSGAETAKIKQAEIDMNGRIKSAVLLYVAAKGKIDSGFQAKNLIDSRYLTDIKDPWGDEYNISVSGNTLTIAPAKNGQAEKAKVEPVKVDLSSVLY